MPRCQIRCTKIVGVNHVHKLPTNEFLKNIKYTIARNEKQIDIYFPLDPRTETTRSIFHYIPFNVTIHIYKCGSIHKHQSISPRLEHGCSPLDHI